MPQPITPDVAEGARQAREQQRIPVDQIQAQATQNAQRNSWMATNAMGGQDRAANNLANGATPNMQQQQQGLISPEQAQALEHTAMAMMNPVEILKQQSIYIGENPFLRRSNRYFKNPSECCLNCLTTCDRDDKDIDNWCDKYNPNREEYYTHLLKSKNKDEHCSNCEYSLSPEVIDSIIEENSEYRDIVKDAFKDIKLYVSSVVFSFYKENKQLSNFIKYGIAFHNAGLSMNDRQVIEDSFKMNAIKIICTTSTLSQGVNLPARLVIIKSTNC